MKVEKIPSVICDECGSNYVIITQDGKECDECNRITANTSDYLNNKKDKREKLLDLLKWRNR